MTEKSRSSLRENQHILIRQLANCVESTWTQHLSLSPYEIPAELGYVEGSLEGDKLTIENYCYQTPQFRKLHLELARVGNRLDILHCVMFPRSDYPLPIFGVDLVGSQEGIGAAIVDLSPISCDRILPKAYQKLLRNLPRIQFSQPRALPKWGDIFSDYCLFIRPADAQEEQLFLSQVKHFLDLHCQIAATALPIVSEPQKAEILAGQNYYCTKQQQNDKTRRVLEKFLGQTWTDRYIKTMLFDAPCA